MNRRTFVRTAAIASALVGVATLPIRALAAVTWNKQAFQDEVMNGAMNDLFDSSEHQPSDKIKLKTPEIAENGAAVPITVDTSLENVDSIAVFSSVNQRPLIGYFTFASMTLPQVATRVKLGKTGDVTAVVRSDGKLYSATNEVKVTIGGCGG